MSELAAEILELALTTARKAGELVSARPANFDLNQKSSIDDFATQMDHASEKLIVESILAARPDDGLIGEEGASRPSRSGITWVIDPIDGTVNYYYGLPGWNISIWHGVRGGGAFRNGAPIRCNNPEELNKSLVATGFSYDRETRIKQSNFITTLVADVRDIRRTGAAATDLCAVATGWVDAYFESNLNEWDIAAGGLIAREAGALLSGRQGSEANKEMTLCAGPALHALLSQRIG